MITAKQIKPNENEYEVTFDIHPLADKLKMSKQRCAELLADELMKVIGLI